MEKTSLMSDRRYSVARGPHDALLFIIPDRAVPETRHLAGFVAHSKRFSCSGSGQSEVLSRDGELSAPAIGKRKQPRSMTGNLSF
jgi:hypothetical protein